MAYIADSKTSISRNYFKTSHSKSPCDGLGCIVKNTCLRAVTSGAAVLGDTDSVFQYCKGKLSHGPQKKEKAGKKIEISKWDFVFVGECDVDHTMRKEYP